MIRSFVVKTVFSKEFRELLRDRRSLMVMFGVPLVVYPLLFAGIGALAQSKIKQQQTQTRKLVVLNPGAAPELVRRLSLPESRFTITHDPVPDADVQQGHVQAVLEIPPDAERTLLSNPTSAAPTSPLSTTPSTTQATTAPDDDLAPADARGPQFKITVDRSRGDSDSTESRLRGILQGYERWVLEQRLKSRDVPLDLLAPLSRTTVDLATQDQRLGRFLAQLLPLLLLVTGMLGAFFPALNATTTERELGTLETLLVTPVSRTELLLAKGLLVLGCSILTAFLNLVSMSLVFTNIAAQASANGGGGLGAVAINPYALALAFLSVIPALVLFSAIVMCVGMIARTYREANSFAAPVMMLPMAAMAIGMADPETTRALLATPIANTTILIRDILTARFTWPNFALAAGANLLFATVVLSIAARLFTNEQLVNPAWEPLSLKGFKRKSSARKGRGGRLPTVDEALVLIALGMLVQFYGGPWLAQLYKAGVLNIFTLIASLLSLSFLLPPLLFAIVLRYDLPRVFSLRLPSPLAVLTGLLLGLGLMPLAMGYGQLQSYLLPAEPSDAARSVAQLLDTGFSASPLLTAFVFGVVPGICEEFLFRGVVLSALRKKLNPHAAVWITALLFAAIHLDFAGLLPRTVLGAALGYLTLRTGSLLPAVLLHATFNASQVGLIAHYLPSAFATTQPANGSTEAAIPDALKPLSPQALTRLLLGALSVTAAALLYRLLPPATPEAPTIPTP